MKKLFLTLIVVLACFGSAFAQGYVGVNPNGYESHWNTFDYHDYLSQEPFVAAIAIEGQLVTLEDNVDNWSSLEVAAFVTNDNNQEECRGNLMWLTDEYVLEYGDPYLTIDGFPIYYNTVGGTVYFKMFDHLNNIEYTECTITYLGEAYTVTAGYEVTEGWGDGEPTVILNFTAPVAPATCSIVLDANNTWTMDFESATNTELLPYEQHDACWTWTRLVELPIDYLDTLPHLYYKADDDAHAQFAHGNYSLRLWNRGVYAMPILDSTININDLKMSFYTRHSYSFYTLMVGVMTDPEDPDTFEPVAYVDNGASLNMEYFEFNFANYDGEGRYIAFKNVRPSASSFDGAWGDVHSVNYIDDITISLMEGGDCVIAGLEQDFEDVTNVTTKLTGAMPECWALVQRDVDVMPFDKMPQVYYQASLANSGNYSFRMADRGVVALPTLESNLHDVRLNMYVRQPNEQYQLEIGIWEDNIADELPVFVPVALVNNSSTGYEYVECDFRNYTGNGNRIAFRNTLNGTANYNYSYNYIDDIQIYISSADCYEMVGDDYFENFDNITTSTQPATGKAPDCWDVVREDVVMAYNKYPQVYYNENFASSGTYSLRLADRCVYAMPELNDVNLPEYTLSFTLRQPNTLYQLEVGVWESYYDENDEPVEQFVPVATFHNDNNEVTTVYCDFAEYEGFGNRIAFRNTLSNGRTDLSYSYNYIDDVQLLPTEQAKNNNSAESVIDEMGLDRYLESISVYPNPTVGEIYIGAVDVQKVECYNQMGQLVAVYDNENNISLNSLANGVYTLRITVPQGVTMRKVVKR